MGKAWFDARFGPKADRLRTGLALGLTLANEEAVNEYAASKFKNRAVYGTARYWYGLEAVAHSLVKTAEARVIQLYGRPFAIVEGALIYPWCYGNSTAVSHKQVSVDIMSEFRKSLFAARQVRRHPEQLDIYSLLDYNETADEDVADEKSSEEDDKPLSALMVSYCSNQQAGLLRIVAGDVTLLADGHLDWLDEEEIFFQGAAEGNLAIVQRIEDSLHQGFDSSPEPWVQIELRNDDEKANEGHYDNPNGPDEEEGKKFSGAS